jgi:hypothetical protein
LKTADPSLKNNAQVKEILSWQQDIIRLSADWKENVATKNALLKDCEVLLDELTAKTEMSDAERLQQIERIHAAMLSNLHFASRFSPQLKMYALQKHEEIHSTNTLKRLYEDH